MCVGACMWSWGVDDGTRMHSALRSHQQLLSALLSSFAIFYRRGSKQEGEEGSVI